MDRVNTREDQEDTQEDQEDTQDQEDNCIPVGRASDSMMTPT